MAEAEKKWFWKAALFAVVYELVVTMIGWLLIGAPRTMGAISTFKMTITIGLPMISQLLDAGHQVTGTMAMSNPVGVAWAILSSVLFAGANGFYISQLARSVRERPGTPWSDAKRAFSPLVIWLMIQFVLGIATFPLMAFGSFWGGSASVLLLLTVRYWFLLLEYSIVVGGFSLGKAWRYAPSLRKLTHGAGSRYFWLVLGLNVVLTYLANEWFSLPSLLLFMLLNAFVSSWLQQRLMKHFFHAFEEFTEAPSTGIVSL